MSISSYRSNYKRYNLTTILDRGTVGRNQVEKVELALKCIVEKLVSSLELELSVNSHTLLHTRNNVSEEVRDTT